MTQVARGLDTNGLLLLDVVVNGIVPESLADADLQVQVVGGSGASPGCAGGVGEREWEVLSLCPSAPPLSPASSQAHFPSWTPSRGWAWPGWT